MRRFQGVDLKLERANEHLEALEQAIAVLGPKPYEIIEQRDPQTRNRLFRLVGHPTPAFDRIPMPPVIVGDFVHNLRSALDHAVWQLAQPPVKGRTGFPICIDHSGKSASFYGTADREGIGVRALTNVGADAFDYIEGKQPYNRLRKRDELWMLNELWNEDKHRNVVVVAKPSWNQPMLIATLHGRDLYEGEIKLNPVNDPDVLLVLDEASDSQVNLEPSPTQYVTFGKPGPAEGRLVVPTLHWLHRYVRDGVLPGLQQFL